MSVTITHRSYLSIGHLSAATLFADQCRSLEATAGSTVIDSAERRQHHACAVSTVIIATAFLEATINELFADCADKNPTERINAIPARDLMGRLWVKGIPRTASYSILQKYEIALELNGKPSIDTGAKSHQCAKLLIELRNALIHYEPETIASCSTNEMVSAHKLEKRLKGKFPENQLTGAGNPFYPDKLLGAGCAAWSVSAAISFADEFFRTLEVPATYEHVRSVYMLASAADKSF